MKRSRISMVAWALFAIVLALVILNPFLKYRSSNGALNALDVTSDLSTAIFLLLCAVVGELIISRQPGNMIGWLLMLIAVSNSISILLGYLLQQLIATGSPPTLELYLLVWFDNWGWWLALAPLFLVLLLFPNGKPPTPRWGWVGYLILFCFAFGVLMVTFSARLVSSTTSFSLPNPIGWLSTQIINGLDVPYQVLLVVCAICCGAAMLVRFRRAQVVEKAQIKWLLYACSLFLIAYIGGFIIRPGGYWGITFYLAIICIPAAIGVAILRYHLWDIDLIIRRSLVYGSLSLILAAFYAGSVLVLQRAFTQLTGQASPAAVVISTLGIVVLFNPLRSRIQQIIDRRFFRKKYDAQQVLSVFASTARDETDLDALTTELQRVVQETMQPEQVKYLAASLATGEIFVKRILAAWLSITIVLVSDLILVWLLYHSTGFDVGVLSGMLLMAGMVVVGCLIMTRRPENRLGWLFCAVGVVWAISHTILAYVDYLAFQGSRPGGWVPWLAMFGSFFNELAFINSVTFMFLLFPDGRLPSPRWRIVAWAVGGVLIILFMFHLFTPGPLSQASSIDNPLGFTSLAPYIQAIDQLQALFFICTLTCLASIFVRYRNSNAVVKRQIKWMAYFGLVMAGLFLIQTIVPGFWKEPPVSTSLTAIIDLVFSMFPLVIGIAILRHRLYDIDIIIRRTLVYGTLTLLLAGFYAGSVLVLQRAFTQLTGQASPAAVVISTLGIVILFNPLRSRIQQIIDRRFFRRKYDTQQVLSVFAQTARDETDLDALTSELRRVVQETMQPEHLGTWIGPASRLSKDQ